MKLPQRPPDWTIALKQNLEAITGLLSQQTQSLNQLSNKANEENYLYWEQFKYLKPLIAGITPAIAWALIKLGRKQKAKEIPLVDPATGQKFIYNIPYSIGKWLHQIDRNVPLAPFNKFVSEQRERFMISSLMEEAIASSQIEGAVTTREVAKEMLRTNRPPQDKSERMILNNYRAITYIVERQKMPLDTKMLLELHEIVTKDAIDKPEASGRFRLPDEEIVVTDILDGSTVYTPPPASKIEERLNVFFAFANNDDEYIHPVLKGIILHFWMAYEHPFYDGNGRASRAIFYWYMLKNKYWAFEFLSLSSIILRSRKKYDRAFLYTEYDECDLTYFIFFNVRAIKRAFEELSKYLIRKEAEKVGSTRLIRKFPGLNARQYQILSQALIDPNKHFTINNHVNETGVVYQTARTDLFGLSERGLLDVSKRSKTFIFFANVDLPRKVGD